MEQWLERMGKYGLAAEGEQRLEQLQTLVGALGKVVKRPAAVGGALTYYKQCVDAIVNLTKGVKENEYQKFKNEMGDLVWEKAKEKYDEIKAGFVAEWAAHHWLRYQAEVLQGKLNAMPNP